jgi:hypothetical protein
MLLLFLFAAAFAGNHFPFALIFGLDFLFGSIAVLVIVYCYGIRWGVLAAIVSGLYTLELWNHPYALIIFTVEALFVGLALRRTSNMLLWDGIFWLLIGMPLVWVLYRNLLQTESTQTWLVMFKDAVNGIFNTLIASLLVTHTRLRTWPGHTRREPLVPISQAVFNISVGCVLFPTLFLLFSHSREALQSVERDIQNDLISQSKEAEGIFYEWLQPRAAIVRRIGDFASGQDGPSPALQRDTALLARAFPDCAAVFVRTSEMNALTFYAADRTQTARLRPALEQQAAEALRSPEREAIVARWDTPRPWAMMFMPTLTRPATKNKPAVRGVVVAALDLTQVSDLLGAGLSGETMSATVIDAERNEVTRIGKRASGTTLPATGGRGTMRQFESGIYHWLPPETRPAVELWKNSIFLRETPLRGTPWTLSLQAPLAQRHDALNAAYYNNLLLVLILLVATLLLAPAPAWHRTRPVDRRVCRAVRARSLFCSRATPCWKSKP